MNSLRLRLFALLLVATGAVWLSAVMWIQTSTRAEVERVLDARLREAAQMVSSLISEKEIAAASAAGLTDPTAFDFQSDGYSRQLSCQIWSLDGALVSRSAHAPATRLAEIENGFSQNVVDGETWRVFTVVNADLGVRIMVGDNLSVRRRLVSDVTTGLLVPAGLVLPLLAIFIWLSVGRGLLPLDRMAAGLAARPANDLHPMPSGPLPRELRPVTTALNDLFRRVSAAREHERSFVAFAAHELKTPLAGLRTQAQIAKIAPDEATRRHALDSLERGVLRTDRMVRQLLELASVEAEARAEPLSDVALSDIVRDVVGELHALAEKRGVETVVEIPSETPQIGRSQFFLSTALRNLLENAIEASPSGEAVDVALRRDGVDWVLSVMDRGPGIPEGERARVQERFYRGSNATGDGSGLGLSIARSAAERLGGDVRHRSRPGGGEVAELVFRTT